MFKSLRWRLTLWFVCLTAVVYASSAIFGTLLFRQGLTAVIEDELEALVEEIEPAIELRGDTPSLQDWARSSLVIPFKFLPTIQLYDKDGQLLERYGPRGVVQLYKNGGEFQADNHAVKVYSAPLFLEGKLVGHLQIELNLTGRDHAVQTYIDTVASVAPFLLLALGVAGYVFATLAARPIEMSFGVLRRFVSDAGHELGTPIAIIQANAEALEPDVENNEPIANKLAVIVRSTERLAALVEDLSLLSKMESPQLQQRRVDLDLSKLVKIVTEDFETLFNSKSISIASEIEEDIIVLGDAEALKRLLTNLLQNALRYTESGGTVKVSLASEGRSAKLNVSDTGVGIPEESVPKIFDRFYRVEQSRNRAAGGAGLGLSIARAIADAHKGKIEVASVLGKGTTFSVTIPLR